MSSVGAITCDASEVAEPGDLLSLAAASGVSPKFYWEEPARGLSIAALGVLAEIRSSGPGRFAHVSREASELFNLMRINPAAREAMGPLVVGGFGFSDRDSAAPAWREFPSARFFLPQLLWVRRGNRCTLARLWRAGEKERTEALLADSLAAARKRISDNGAAPARIALPAPPDRESWRIRVERAGSLIRSGRLSKVVLSRKSEIELAEAIDPALLLCDVRTARPSCFSFWFGAGATSFVGSTPELLVRVEAGRVASDALAGSAPRGATQAEDRAIASDLLASRKNREEHELVVAAVRSALEAVAGPLAVSDIPEVRLLPEAQHLYTPIEGPLRCPRTAIEIAGLLHPTPAVCGVPREDARRLIEAEEPERGWYSGVIGWMNPAGEGEFAVALRSALLDRRRVSMWAGAGIVAGSDPDLEFDETEAKMSALLRSVPIGATA